MGLRRTTIAWKRRWRTSVYERRVPEAVEGPPASFEREPTAADHFEGFLTGTVFADGYARRGTPAKQIADIIKAQERHEMAEELLRRFDPPASYSPGCDTTYAPGH